MPSARRGVWQPPLPDCLVDVASQCLPDTTSTRQSGRGPSGRRHLADGRLADGIRQTESGRRRLPDAVCQVPSARRRLPDRPLPDCLADGVWPSGRQCLADDVCQTALCQTAYRLPDTASARRGVWQTASDRRRLADTVSSRWHLADAAMPDSVCQTVWQRAVWKTVCGRRHLADTVCQTLSA